MRSLVVAATLALAPAAIAAQPVDPYAPAPPPAGAPRDVDVDTAVAAGLVARARALIADGDDASARQLLTEALAREPAEPARGEATALLAEVDARLAARVPPTVAGPPVVSPADIYMDRRPAADALPPPPPEAPRGSARSALALYGVLGGAAIGSAIAGVDSQGAVAAGLALGGLAGGVLGYTVGKRLGGDRVAAHVIGSGVVWGGVAGGLFADVVSGLTDTDTRDVAVGAAVGSGIGALIGLGMRSGELTLGDVAVIDAGAALGTLAGFQLGFVMAPPESEAYTLNGTLGAAGGYVIGHLAARKLDVTPARVAKVTALAAVGAALPWLLWSATNDDTTDDDEQTFGLLSLAGMAGGLYLGAKLTRDQGGVAATDDAPLALARRGSRGGWRLGGPALAPVRSPEGGRGLAIAVVAGAW
ncbi:MAG: hypothetical protein KA201_20570 [Kofleriaceae bacterium]|nr:hypothetical protein [Kofleriaceae bacterium]